MRSFRRMRKETNWDLAGKARSKCVTDVGHELQLPLGPSPGRLSEKLGVDGMAHSTLGSPFGRAVSEAD